MASRLEGRRVLLVEDSPYIPAALMRLLESEGAVVLAVGGPGAASGRRWPRRPLRNRQDCKE